VKAGVRVLADDLTGALDVLAPFADAGVPAEVRLVPGVPEAAASGVDAAARDLDFRRATAALGEAAAVLLGGYDGLVFAKVDSTLRGHPDAVAAVALAAAGRELAVVCPAVPAQGRRVRGAAVLTPDGRRLALGALCQPGWTVVDAQTDHELDVIAAGILEVADRVVAVGAAGLAQALARAIGSRRPGPAVAPSAAPLLFVVGSQSPVATAQVAALASAGVTVLDALAAAPGAVAEALATGSVALTGAMTSAGGDALGVIAATVEHALVANGATRLLLTGGATARAVLLRLGITHLAVLGTAGDGIAALAAADGRSVFTKPGAFGRPGALVDLYKQARVPSTSSGTGSPVGS
jgi:uncharacterized protein YgbK (DUF1537 family)